jgi:5-methylcytosine-specific restriction protein A
MTRAPSTCTKDGCAAIAVDRGRCLEHKHKRAPERRVNRERYNSIGWLRNKANYIRAHPVCCLCGGAAETPDHWPVSRRDLVAAGDQHADSWDKLRPLCKRCHSRETARLQPGGWNRR